MTDDAAILLSEIRYAERLCLRTARLYRRAQTLGVFLTTLGGSATLSALSGAVPAWVSLVGAGCFAAFGAAMLAVRPAEKALANETDARRYAGLRTDGQRMDEAGLRAALEKARETDAPEIETLRDVAYNDVMREVGQDAYIVPLTLPQRLLAAVA